jgi:DNA-3-methyladenine glycosylase II
MDIITISSAADIDRAVAQLNIPQFNVIYEKCSPIPLRRKPPGFASLLQAIIGQQVSVASAAAIWERIQAAGLCRAAAMAQASTEDLARLGLSRPKIRYAKALALSGLDYEGLAALSDAEVLSRLTAITGHRAVDRGGLRIASPGPGGCVSTWGLGPPRGGTAGVSSAEAPQRG